jgi:hypothetical protein
LELETELAQSQLVAPKEPLSGEMQMQGLESVTVFVILSLEPFVDYSHLRFRELVMAIAVVEPREPFVDLQNQHYLELAMVSVVEPKGPFVDYSDCSHQWELAMVFVASPTRTFVDYLYYQNLELATEFVPSQAAEPKVPFVDYSDYSHQRLELGRVFVV